MIFDLEVLQDESDYPSQFDVCIVGAGAAGITLATELGKSGLKVALCEAGGTEYTQESQDCYKGSIEGDPYLPLDVCRLRFFGGTTNHWEGYCRSFEEVDFNLGYLGEKYKWPLGFEELQEYLIPACEILEVKHDFEYTGSFSEKIQKIKFQFSPPVNFRVKYESEIAQSDNVYLFLNANLVDVDGGQRVIKSARFDSYKGQSLSVAADRFVFAMGGIENSRYLLWFAKKYGNKYFDSETPIGKYWMEHPHFTLGRALVDKSVSSLDPVWTFYSLTQSAQLESKILNCGFRLEAFSDDTTSRMVKEVMCVAPKLGKKLAGMANQELLCGVRFFAAWEQAPEVSNAVTLSKDSDSFGIPKVNLKWRKYPLDRETINESTRLFNEWLMTEDLGRVQLQQWLVKDLEYPEHDELGGSHHMGGTRMSHSSDYGVVDRDCKVFGSDNLYMAGSSIFTTGGHNNPTLPIVQFTLRLAEHLLAA